MAIKERLKQLIRPAVTQPETSDTRKLLSDRAMFWLSNIGCEVIVSNSEPSHTGEPAYAIGWCCDRSVVVDVIISRSEFMENKQKRILVDPDACIGDWRLYMVPAGLIKPREIPADWGLVEVCLNLNEIISVHQFSNESYQHASPPFSGNRLKESRLLTVAIPVLQLDLEEE